MQKVKEALRDGFVEKPLQSYDNSIDLDAIVVRISHGDAIVERISHGLPTLKPQFEVNPALKEEGFQIIKRKNVIFLNAHDRVGGMYGLLDIAETIQNESLSAVQEKTCNPFHGKRGIKHNLPYEPYDEGSPFTENRETMMDISYWKAYIEMLASYRYNVLSLWSENPFPMMFRLDKYPRTNLYSEDALLA